MSHLQTLIRIRIIVYHCKAFGTKDTFVALRSTPNFWSRVLLIYHDTNNESNRNSTGIGLLCSVLSAKASQLMRKSLMYFEIVWRTLEIIADIGYAELQGRLDLPAKQPRLRDVSFETQHNAPHHAAP